MDYEIVELEEKKAVGITARVNGRSREMRAVIGGLWERFFGSGIYDSIQNKQNGKALGIYMDYAGDEPEEYTLITACEVKPGREPQVRPEGVEVQARPKGMEVQALPERLEIRIIPKGTYAKFVVRGELHRAIGEFWKKLHGMELPRTFNCDFEEYQNENAGDAEIHVYIGVKEELGESKTK